jgi:hypothetical protein
MLHGVDDALGNRLWWVFSDDMLCVFRKLYHAEPNISGVIESYDAWKFLLGVIEFYDAQPYQGRVSHLMALTSKIYVVISMTPNDKERPNINNVIYFKKATKVKKL